MHELFSFTGRRKRGSFFRIMVALNFIFIGFLYTAGAIIDPMMSAANETEKQQIDVALNVIIILFIVPYTYVSLAVTAQRFHDIGQSAIMLVMLWVPFVNLGVIARLLLRPSQHGANAFGPFPHTGYAAYSPGTAGGGIGAEEGSVVSMGGVFSSGFADGVDILSLQDEPTDTAGASGFDSYETPLRVKRPETGHAAMQPEKMGSAPNTPPPRPAPARAAVLRRQPARPAFGRRVR